jgi:hypothetical protein
MIVYTASLVKSGIIIWTLNHIIYARTICLHSHALVLVS